MVPEAVISTEALDVGRLRLLREVALRGSIAAAARAVGLSASAVSQQLALLEREAGVGLIERSSRGVQLTGVGLSLAERARLIDELLELARADLDSHGGAVVGQVRVGAVASAAATLVSAAATELAAVNPGLTLTVTVDEPSASIDALLAADLDIAVVDVYDGVPLALPDYLQATELLTEPLVLVAASGDFADRGKASLASLADQDWVMPPEAAACGRAVRIACRSVGFEPRVRWETDDMWLLAGAVAAGHGVAVLPRLAVATRPGIDLVGLRAPKLSRRLTALTRSSAAGRAVVAATLAALARCSAETTRFGKI